MRQETFRYYVFVHGYFAEGSILESFHILWFDYPLRSLENVILTPHMGYVTEDSYDQFFRQAVENIESYLEGRVPAGAMNPQVLADRMSRGK
jgi:lactate dehydrogenase-like 2-hydroxyacid dehydrogenase